MLRFPYSTRYSRTTLKTIPYMVAVHRAQCPMARPLFIEMENMAQLNQNTSTTAQSIDSNKTTPFVGTKTVSTLLYNSVSAALFALWPQFPDQQQDNGQYHNHPSTDNALSGHHLHYVITIYRARFSSQTSTPCQRAPFLRSPWCWLKLIFSTYIQNLIIIITRNYH